MNSITRSISTALAIGALVAATACGDSTSPEQAIAGVYPLATLNGQTVPFVFFQNEAGRVRVLAGSLSLRSDRSYTQTMNVESTFFFAPELSRNNTNTENGTYIVEGTTIVFNMANGPSYQGAIVPGRSVTYVFDGDAATFRR